jgi:hypothetical protein
MMLYSTELERRRTWGVRVLQLVLQLVDKMTYERR